MSGGSLAVEKWSERARVRDEEEEKEKKKKKRRRKICHVQKPTTSVNVNTTCTP